MFIFIDNPNENRDQQQLHNDTQQKLVQKDEMEIRNNKQLPQQEQHHREDDACNVIGAHFYVLSENSAPNIVNEENFTNFPLTANENSVELLAQFAADLVYEPSNVCGSNTHSNFVDTNENQLYVHDEHRTLLHSSMSPLLAAVNDIAKRDAEMRMLNNDFNDPSISSIVDNSNVTSLLPNENLTFTENSFNGLDCYIIPDSPVYCRAKASLPSQYLSIGGYVPGTNEPLVFANVIIPHRTKFGPFEGEIHYINELDLDVLNVKTPRYYPLLMVDESHILNVSNENTSNWMRYIRLAENYIEQNLELILELGKLYFLTTRTICCNEEIRVGYSESYATRFLLPKLHNNQMAKKSKQSLECLNTDLCRTKIQNTDINENNKKIVTTINSKPLVASKRKRNIITYINPLVNLRKTSKVKTKKIVYKCNFCAKHYCTPVRLEIHKQTHTDKQLKKKITCHVCNQKCATKTALATHMYSHYNTLYSCVYCEQTYKYVRSFKQHVLAHQSENGTYECLLCNKHYAAYHLVRKHVRLFHTTRHYDCDKCDMVFHNINSLERHKLIHVPKKKYTCSQCRRQYRRRDHLKNHIKRIHTIDDKKKQKTEEFNTISLTTNEHAKNIDLPKDSNTIGLTLEKCNDIDNTSRYLNLSPIKASVSTSNRRKPRPIKLKADKLNTLTNFSRDDTLSAPFLISEQELHEEFNKTDDFIPIAIKPKTLVEPNKAIDNCNAFKENIISEKYRVNSKEMESNITTKYKENLVQTNETAVNENSNINPLYPYKCHLCESTSFKRRGILVNHLSKKHPAINLDDIECLRRPLLKHKLIFPCPYCKNVYKSNIKRKGHILKHHPGEELPKSMRYTTSTEEAEARVVGTIEAEIYKCSHCPRQYGARSRLLTHYRKSHPDVTMPTTSLTTVPTSVEQQCQQQTTKISPSTARELILNREKLVDIPNDSFFEEKNILQMSEQFPYLEPEINITSYPTVEESSTQSIPPVCISPENKLLKLSSAATLELSRFDFFNDRSVGTDDLHRLPSLFGESSLGGIDDDKFNQRSIELQFFEKIGKL